MTGESVFYLGQAYRMKVEDAQAVPVDFDGEWFHVRRGDPVAATACFRTWFIEAGSDWLAARAKAMLPRTGGGEVTVRVGDLGYRWGSCGKGGVIHLNWRLLQLPVRLIDYVVAHELVHRVERNHTRRFWEMLERAMPDCRDREGQLQREWHGYVTFDLQSPARLAHGAAAVRASRCQEDA